ncbi:MAG TPA: zf-HC2 domain-containing protein [Candidatus Binataceae bacterium]|nr:zf-HC2 domain-containing protein [Candidatus Binataceae bacterium]
MAACGEIELLLGAFEDGELRPREMEAVAFHVVGCDACRAALESYRSLGAALREVSTAPRLDGFTQAVMARIARERPPLGSRIREFWESLGSFGSVIQIAGVATASAVVTFVLLAPRLSESFHPVATAPLAIAQRTQTLQTQPKRNQIALNQTPQGPIAQTSGPSPASPLMTASAATTDPSGVWDQASAIAARDSEELVSELGAGNGPSVAVWDEPRSGTTVVWVPDQQP